MRSCPRCQCPAKRAGRFCSNCGMALPFRHPDRRTRVFAGIILAIAVFFLYLATMEFDMRPSASVTEVDVRPAASGATSRSVSPAGPTSTAPDSEWAGDPGAAARRPP